MMQKVRCSLSTNYSYSGFQVLLTQYSILFIFPSRYYFTINFKVYNLENDFSIFNHCSIQRFTTLDLTPIRDYHPLQFDIPINSQSESIKGIRSPLLTPHLLFLFYIVTEMFHFTILMLTLELKIINIYSKLLLFFNKQL